VSRTVIIRHPWYAAAALQQLVSAGCDDHQWCAACWSTAKYVTLLLLLCLQENVYKAVQQVPWLQDVELEWRTSDGLISADIAATVHGMPPNDQQPEPQQRQVVIEVDGPWHFRRPDGALTGTTRFRNRALAARGCVVVSLPW
jgi:hypothetical protein